MPEFVEVKGNLPHKLAVLKDRIFSIRGVLHVASKFTDNQIMDALRRVEAGFG